MVVVVAEIVEIGVKLIVVKIVDAEVVVDGIVAGIESIGKLGIDIEVIIIVVVIVGLCGTIWMEISHFVVIVIAVVIVNWIVIEARLKRF